MSNNFRPTLVLKNYCRPELERIYTLFGGCLFCRGAIPKGSFLRLAPTIEAETGKVLPVEAVGKIVRNTCGMLLFPVAVTVMMLISLQLSKHNTVMQLMILILIISFLSLRLIYGKQFIATCK